ncbi:MAG: hypothetical protein RLZZ397_586 [Pseudomonadota bacterium]|jgi:drug/metabolite transporter (DMT)-like permease
MSPAGRHHPSRGIVAMLIAVAAFSMMDATLKWLSKDLDPMQLTALRGLLALPLALAWVHRRQHLSLFWPSRSRLYVIRGILGVIMLWSFTKGLDGLALSEAYMVLFLAPVIITLLAGLFLHEPIRGFHWVILTLNLLAIGFVLRPSVSGLLSVDGLWMLISTICYALGAVIMRLQSRTDSTDIQVLWLTLFMAGLALPLSWSSWQPILAHHIPLLLLMTLTGFVGQVAITSAFFHARAATVTPFEYSALAWGLILDVALWQIWPHPSMLVGAAVIVACGVWLARRETKAPVPAPSAPLP